ncbi:AlbA family DNA-binding domain-containing protein [Echinicola vietnamensis]|uniref:Putative transcriptional regulator with HTH domain n=1 Tax=Echinicola vietnamensis (strain DSM 17526 / LMG 23754 / KMM 6221) TaxID=926556 RepID=L0FWS7_ECHVK|nr:ATP-binding protein [Echinicola vietnamensis]AGA77488.1 putative transcriptional regulator with HTH domain [Echinicola vietnamensis DSM 17526]
MTLQEVTRLARQGEGLHIEFKKKVAHPEKIVREVIALANTDGGHLLVGVDDDGSVSGQRYVEEDVYVLNKAIKEMIRPMIDYEHFVIPITEKKGVAVYHFHKSPKRPHYLYEEGRKRSFVRVADRTVQASKEVWEILRRGKKEKDIIFNYGEKETKLMHALSERETITLKEYSKVARLPRFIASKTLVRLVLANVLQVIPQEQEDLFKLKAN